MRQSFPPSSRRPKAVGTYTKSLPMVTAKQVRMLIVTAQKAYAVAQSHGLDEGLKFDDWRKVQLQDEFHTTSFRKLRDRDFGRALNVFRRLTGEELGYEFKGLNEDIPYRKKAWYILRQAIRDAKVNPEYVATILKRKFKLDIPHPDGESIDTAVKMLHAHEVEQLAYTLQNRARNRDKDGNPLNRDKKQRHERATTKKAGTATAEVATEYDDEPSDDDCPEEEDNQNR